MPLGLRFPSARPIFLPRSSKYRTSQIICSQARIRGHRDDLYRQAEARIEVLDRLGGFDPRGTLADLS
jgi:hypothetical protein